MADVQLPCQVGSAYFEEVRLLGRAAVAVYDDIVAVGEAELDLIRLDTGGEQLDCRIMLAGD